MFPAAHSLYIYIYIYIYVAVESVCSAQHFTVNCGRYSFFARMCTEKGVGNQSVRYREEREGDDCTEFAPAESATMLKIFFACNFIAAYSLLHLNLSLSEAFFLF